MKRTFSGFQTGKSFKKPKQGITVTQVAPIAIVLLVFIAYIMIKNSLEPPPESVSSSQDNTRFFYAVNKNGAYSLFYVDRKLNPEYGAGLLTAFEDGFRDVSSNGAFLENIDDDVNINSIELKGNYVIIDFNKSLSFKDLSKEREEMALKAIAYTVGGYFNVSKVKITVEGEAYKSNNLSFSEDTMIDVN